MGNPTVNLRGSRWYICPEPSQLGAGYVLLQRVSFKADLQRYGQVATRIDVSREELANRTPTARTA